MGIYSAALALLHSQTKKKYEKYEFWTGPSKSELSAVSESKNCISILHNKNRDWLQHPPSGSIHFLKFGSTYATARFLNEIASFASRPVSGTDEQHKSLCGGFLLLFVTRQSRTVFMALQLSKLKIIDYRWFHKVVHIILMDTSGEPDFSTLIVGWSLSNVHHRISEMTLHSDRQVCQRSTRFQISSQTWSLLVWFFREIKKRKSFVWIMIKLTRKPQSFKSFRPFCWKCW